MPIEQRTHADRAAKARAVLLDDAAFDLARQAGLGMLIGTGVMKVVVATIYMSRESPHREGFVPEDHVLAV